MARGGGGSSDHSSLHINFLELETVLLALKRFQRWLCGSHVLDGQHYSDALSEQWWRNQVQVLGLEGEGDYSVVSHLLDHFVGNSHFRTGQCDEKDQAMWRRIASLDFESKILDAWSTPQNGLSTAGWLTFSSIFGDYLQ